MGIVNFKNSSLKIFIPFAEQSTYLNAIQASDKKIYIPMHNFDQNEQGMLLHEFDHYINQILMNNEGKPYKNKDIEAEKSYYIAAKEGLANVLLLFGKIQYTDVVKEIVKTETITLRDICTKIDTEVPLHIFGTYGHPNPKERNDMLAKVFLGQGSASDEHKSQFLKHYLDNTVDSYKLDNDAIYFLSVISDFCLLEDDNALEPEFIARVAESKTRENSSSIKQIIMPVEEFWYKYGTAIVYSLKEKEGLHECNDIVSEAQIEIAGESTGYKTIFYKFV